MLDRQKDHFHSSGFAAVTGRTAEVLMSAPSSKNLANRCLLLFLRSHRPVCPPSSSNCLFLPATNPDSCNGPALSEGTCALFSHPQRSQRRLLCLGQAPDPRNIEALVGSVASQRSEILATVQVPDRDGPVIPAIASMFLRQSDNSPLDNGHFLWYI
jgi:hypothetical protein